MARNEATVAVVSFYRFVDIADPQRICAGLQAYCDSLALVGTVLLAQEGCNGTLAGDPRALRSVLGWLQEQLHLARDIDGRWTESAEPPFRRMRVRVRNEIVTLGRPDIRPQQCTGRHVSPADWNRLIADPQTLLIDTRNHYEIEVGTFPGAVDPGTDSFRQFAGFARQLADGDRDRPVAMFCTGGIRCEKASALMQELGFSNVFQLQGGILNYLESVAAEDSRWQGECFVFDTRVAVDRDLAEGRYVLCHACSWPLSSEDLDSPDYREGVSCPKCASELQSGRGAGLIEHSTITCPNCGHASHERMPVEACQYFYECRNCKGILKPLAGDCCVFCSFGDVPCPPIQLHKDCCTRDPV